MRRETNANRPMRLREAGLARFVPGLLRKSSGIFGSVARSGSCRPTFKNSTKLNGSRWSARRQREWNMDSARAERAVLGGFVGIALREHALTHATHSLVIPHGKGRSDPISAFGKEMIPQQ